ncbi:NAD-dependent 5,10-methylenetetrahydrafolate dehydrogenase [Plenodomus lingam]|uniref:NAD-dependent 5,10-methylenetetrahydrafolate dehydrogenase n=1 Tax=Leptosphaeria maculans TaxID=5022 RepID=UPI00331ED06A|nr:NAD-dependent 5,10-methylenetetrahydrafolate dehydrogenase [Plenodomus lingam]
MAEEKPNCKVILANNIAKSLLEEVRGGLSKIDRKPLLVGFLSSADPAARVYAEWTGKTCVENGFAFDLREVDRELLEDQLIEANNDPSVDGIIVYYPIFGNRQDQYLQQIVSIDKDVEGLSHRYIFNMYQNIRFLDPANTKKSILPCTPLAVIKILEYLRIYNTILPYGNRLHGRTITVINRSEVVGRPLAALLANDGAHVYSVDINDVQEFTRGVGLRKRRHEVVEKPGWTIENCLPISDVVISGVPGDKYKVPLETMKDGAVCINFSSERNFTPEVKEKASIYVPAIGKVTIAVLLRNLLRLAQNRIDAAANNVESKSSEEANALASS